VRAEALKLVLFDTTSTYFEGRGPEGLAKLGYSRDRRSDRVQVITGVFMTGDDIPVAHYVFPGNTADIDAFRQALTDVKKRFPLEGNVVIVADRGWWLSRCLRHYKHVEQVALAYKELWRVEYAFRDLKSGLEVSPVYHWTPTRVRGHIGVCFLH
jgi:transposase